MFDNIKTIYSANNFNRRVVGLIFALSLSLLSYTLYSFFELFFAVDFNLYLFAPVIGLPFIFGYFILGQMGEIRQSEVMSLSLILLISVVLIVVI